MKVASARSRRASAPDSTTNRAPDNLAARSKSMPRRPPSSSCSLGANSKRRGSPQLRSSTLSLSSAPSGTSGASGLGTVASTSASSAARSRSASSAAWIDALSAPTSAISGAASPPCACRLPISLDSALRRAWACCTSVCSARTAASRSSSSAAIAGSPRRLSASSSASGCSRTHLRSSTASYGFDVIAIARCLAGLPAGVEFPAHRDDRVSAISGQLLRRDQTHAAHQGQRHRQLKTQAKREDQLHHQRQILGDPGLQLDRQHAGPAGRLEAHEKSPGKWEDNIICHCTAEKKQHRRGHEKGQECLLFRLIKSRCNEHP